MHDTIKFFSEIYMLKRERRSGWSLVNAPQDSLADHVALVAQIAYVLAEMEGANPEKCAAMCLFHDNGEVRIGDRHKVASRYLESKEPEQKALEEQLSNLPESTQKKISALCSEYEHRTTKEGMVAKDADWLETALQAKILAEQGYVAAEDWIQNVSEALETASAKRILADIVSSEDFTNLWWRGLKKMTYTKLKK